MKYVLLAPAVIMVTLFVLWPLGELFHVSMIKTNYITSEWVGFDNYERAFRSQAFLHAAKNSLAYIGILAVITPGVALIVALLVFELPKRWRDASRIVFYIPTLAAGIILAQVWRWIFHVDGPLNWIVGLFGVEPVAWMTHGITAIPMISLTVAMSGWGGNLIIILAAILSIDRSLYDAATIDGATTWQIKARIIVPMIAPVVAALVLLAAIAAPQIFETIYALAPYDHTATVGWIIYREAFMMGAHGDAAAMSVLLMFSMIGLAWAKQRLTT